MNKGTCPEDKILDAARKVFFKNGYKGARMQDIAQEAGISRTTLNYYFRSKSRLFETLFKQTVNSHYHHLPELLAQDQPFDQFLRQFVGLLIDANLEDPLLSLCFVNLQFEQPELLYRKIFADFSLDALLNNFRRKIEQAAARGHIRSVNALHLLESIIAMCVHPILNKKHIMQVTGKNEQEMHQFFIERKEEITNLVLSALRLK